MRFGLCFKLGELIYIYSASYGHPCLVPVEAIWTVVQVEITRWCRRARHSLGLPHSPVPQGTSHHHQVTKFRTVGGFLATD